MEKPLTVEEKMWEQFHKMWTKDASQGAFPEYDKKSWIELERCILDVLKANREKEK